MKEKLIRFMQGRYGVDQFSRFLSILSIVLLVLSMFSRHQLWFYLALAALGYQYFRTFSRNIPKRYAENQKYLEKTAKLRRILWKKKNELKQSRTHHIYRCPSCGQKIRVPRGRGKIEVRCPKCSTKFIKKVKEESMFGYIIVNKQEMKFKEFDCYQSYYCGLCQSLKERFGRSGQMTLSYDMTFVVMLLSALYEPETKLASCKCVAHPLEAHPTRRNEFTEYAADMNILLSYYKCMDDWSDERKFSKRLAGMALKKKNDHITELYPKKAEKIYTLLENIHLYEKAKEPNLDMASGCFGEIMAEIFTCRQDEWEDDLRRMGFFLGKFIYLMDAYEDMDKDLKSGNYNVFLYRKQTMENRDAFEKEAYTILQMMMAECSRAFEKLPIVENVEILRNILYSGVWCRYEMIQKKEKKNE